MSTEKASDLVCMRKPVCSQIVCINIYIYTQKHIAVSHSERHAPNSITITQSFKLISLISSDIIISITQTYSAYICIGCLFRELISH